jgi:hypothetical protein
VLQELVKDDMGLINTTVLTLNDQFAATLPCDFLDDSKVGVKRGQLIKPLIKQDSINRKVAYDDAGNATTYNQLDTTDTNAEPGYLSAITWSTTHYNGWGEFTGRFYGMGAGFQTDTYKIIRERCQIQCSELLGETEIVLEYISDGTLCDTASGFDPYAKETVEAYCEWKRDKQQKGSILSPKGQEYARQRRIYRARKNKLSTDVIKRIIDTHYYASPKQ